YGIFCKAEETKADLEADMSGALIALARVNGTVADGMSFLEILAKDLRERRRSAALAASHVESAALHPAILRGLAYLLRDTDTELRQAAEWALRWLGSKAATKEVLEALLALLRHTDPDVRGSAAERLGEVGVAASGEVLGALVKSLRDRDSTVSVKAAEA